MTEILDTAPDLLAPTDTFPRRHIGPRAADVQAMLKDVETTAGEPAWPAVKAAFSL